MGLIRRLAAWAADDDQGMLAAVTAPAPKLAAAPTVVDDLPHLRAAWTAAAERAWSARSAGRCLACNGSQHEACEGVEAPGGPCQCYDQAHVLVAAPGAPVPAVVAVAGTHRSCREAAARVCACCAPLIAAAIDPPPSRPYIAHQETTR